MSSRHWTMGEAGSKAFGTVLVVDDEMAVLRLIQTIFQYAGFRALPARTGEKAAELFWEHTAELSLLLVDIVLPGISGVDFVEALPTLEPRIPVLFMSAYGQPHLARLGVLETNHPFLWKPFTIPTFLMTIRTVLPDYPIIISSGDPHR